MYNLDIIKLMIRMEIESCNVYVIFYVILKFLKIEMKKKLDFV